VVPGAELAGPPPGRCRSAGPYSVAAGSADGRTTPAATRTVAPSKAGCGVGAVADSNAGAGRGVAAVADSNAEAGRRVGALADP